MRLSWLKALAILGLVLASAPSISATSPLVGKAAPGFALKDRQGQLYALQPARDKPLLVLWFFAADSRPSQEGFLTLDRLAKRFPAGALVGNRVRRWRVLMSPGPGRFSKAPIPQPASMRF